MSFNEALVWSIVRSAVVAGLCVAAGRFVAAGIAAMSPPARRWAITLAAVPVLTPSILVGYTYYSTGLTLVRYPVTHELWYAALLAMKWLPVAAGVWAIAPPPPLSPMATHLRAMAARSTDAHGRLGPSFRFRGSARTGLLAFAVVFILAMGDIETALLINATGWGTALFDAKVAGLVLDEAIARAARPAVVQLVLLALVLGLLVARPADARRPSDRRATPRARRFAWVAVIVSLLGIAVVPVAVVLLELLGVSIVPPGFAAGQSLEGLGLLVKNLDIYREIGASLAFAGVSVTIAMFIARLLGRVRGRIGAVLAVVACVPGLVGALVLALGMQAAFQSDALRALYDTPTPLTITLALLLLPMAIVLRAVRLGARRDASAHVAMMMKSSPRPAAWARYIRWLTDVRPALLVGLVLFSLAYFELTASAILAPPSQTPAVVRLYNFMHYGRSLALSAMVLQTLIVPVAIGLLAWFAADRMNRLARQPSN